MKLSQIKEGVVFIFKNDEKPLPLRGHEQVRATNGKFIYLRPGEGTAPKVLHMETGDEFYFANSVYYEEVLPLTSYIEY